MVGGDGWSYFRLPINCAIESLAAMHDVRKFRIDVHHHYAPPYPSGIQSRMQTPGTAPSDWSPHRHLAFMDRWAIQAAVLSDPPFGMIEATSEKRQAAAREVNDYNRRLIRDHGDRFGVFAAVPLPDVKNSIAEARRALGDLGLDGICLVPHYDGRYLGERDFEPFYAVLNELHAVVFVHPVLVPNAPVPTFAGGERFSDPTLEFVFDSTRTAASLVYSGIPKRFPRIRWIFCHCGGTIPFLAFRLAELHAYDPRFNAVLSEGPATAFASFYYETAQAFSTGQLRMVDELTDREHILFGTDFPPVANLYADNNADLINWPAADLPSGDDPAPAYEVVFGRERERVERDNALELLPSLRKRLEVAGAT